MLTKRFIDKFHAHAIAVIIILLGIYNPSLAYAVEPVKVMIMPFQIHATGDLDYLSTQIADVLSEHLANEGALIVPYKEEESSPESSLRLKPDQMRQLAIQYSADRIIWGGFTLIGERFSLDAYMVAPFDDQSPKSFSIDGNKLENLLKAVKALAVQISLKLFEQEIVYDVNVVGNNRIEADAIIRQVQTKVGDVYKESQLSSDLKTIFNMGFFDDLRVEAESTPNGKNIIFHVKEKPTIRRIKIKGNVRFNDEEVKENLTLSTGAILNIFKVRSNMEQIESMYKEKNYHHITVEYKVLPLKNNQADIEFTIAEGPKVYVTSITFEGEQLFQSQKIKKRNPNI